MAGSKHANKTSFQKGQSGNPGGRSPRVGPNGESLTELARAKTLEMFEVLCELTGPEHEPEMRFKAACAVLDRGHGKPKQAVDMDVQGDIRGTLPIINLTVTRPAEDDGA